MLATKALPEQETADCEAVEEARNLCLLRGIPEESFAAAGEAINSAVDSLAGVGGMLDPKGPARTALAAAIRASVVDGTHQSTATANAMVAMRGTNNKNIRVQPTMQAQGPELLLGAATYGAGLE